MSGWHWPLKKVPVPTLTLDIAEFPEQYAYEVLIFDVERDRRLVAAVEVVSPANKDRPESRQLFVAKCLNLLRQDVCLSIVDLVTIRQFNLYTELLAVLDRSDPAFGKPTPPIYAVTCHKRNVGRKMKLDTWSSSPGHWQARFLRFPSGCRNRSPSPSIWKRATKRRRVACCGLHNWIV